MFTPYKEDYAYGWSVTELSNHKRISHSGGINGFGANISRYVNDDVCVVVLSNFEYAPIGQISKDLAAIVFEEEYELPKERMAVEVDPKIYDAYVGEYQLDTNFILTITKEDNRLFAQAIGQGQPKIEIFPESETEFFVKVINAQITFIKNDKGIVTELILHQNGKDHPAKKIE
jgi:hypothetical protein